MDIDNADNVNSGDYSLVNTPSDAPSDAEENPLPGFGDHEHRRKSSDSLNRGSTSSDTRDPHKNLYTIGEVVSSLREDFPSLSVSKVRYLERRGLLDLQRTDGGYRLFREEDTQLLRSILTLQEREYLPLEVIKQRIDSGIIQSAGGEDSLGESSGREGSTGSISGPGFPFTGRIYSKEELCRELDADARFIEELISVGVIGRRDPGSASRGPTEPALDSRDLEISKMAIEMSKYSIQPRHLRGIVAAVDREVAMFKQVLNPELRSGDDQRVSSAMDNARQLASVDSRLKDLIMTVAIDSLDTRG